MTTALLLPSTVLLTALVGGLARRAATDTERADRVAMGWSAAVVMVTLACNLAAAVLANR